MKRFAIVLCLAMLGAAATFAQDSKSAGPAVIAIHAGKVLDVRTGNYASDQIIWIEGGKIKAVGKAPDVSKQLPAGTKTIDLSKLTVLPGLIDCHTHLTMSPEMMGPRGFHTSYPRSALIGARSARVTLEAGFTTVRNVGAGGYADIALRDAINAGDVPGPRMLASGPPLSITGGHGDENFLAPHYGYSSDGVANGIDGVTTKVRENIKYGADLIKFMATGGVLSEGDNPALEQFSPEEMKAIIDTAHGLGRKVAAHAHGALGIKNAVLAGVDSIEHGSYINDEDIALMKQHGTYLVPTVFLEDWLFANYQHLGFTQSMTDKMNMVLPIAKQNISHAFKEGVKVAFGTDAAVYPHGMNAGEFGTMVKMGLPPLVAIQAATVNAADLLGWSDRVGTIEPGKFGDLVAVDGDPVADVTTLEHVRFVMKKTRFLALENSFHGRTFGAVSITYPAKYREPFAPLVPGVEFVNFNDVADLDRKFDDSVCALVIETIQGEGGIYPVSREFWKRARELATKHDVALIADEIQCGLGRSGRYFAYQAHDSSPDVVTVAKPLAGGLPLGAFIANEKFAAAFTPGMHGTTFGGGPLVCATALEFFNVIEEEKLLANIRERGAELRAGIEKLGAEFDFIREVRGEGLMLGVDLSVDGAPFVAEALRNGLIINCTHDHILRLLPPFNIRRRDVAEFLRKFEAVFASTSKQMAKARAKTQKTETRKQPIAVAAAR